MIPRALPKRASCRSLAAVILGLLLLTAITWGHPWREVLPTLVHGASCGCPGAAVRGRRPPPPAIRHRPAVRHSFAHPAGRPSRAPLP